MIYEFQSVNKNEIKINEIVFDLKPYYNIESDQFMNYYHNLSEHPYNLNFHKDNFYLPISEGINKKVPISSINELVNFIIYSNVLKENNIDIGNLIKQIKKGSHYRDIVHANSLAILAYIYSRCGYKISFLEERENTKNADLTINDIKTDIKVLMPDSSKNKSTDKDIKNVLYLRICQRIKDYFTDGARQADLLFFDVSNDDYFSVLSGLNKEFDEVVSPVKHRIILLKNYFMFPGISATRMRNGKIYSSNNKKGFPDNFVTNGYRIDFDERIWNFDVVLPKDRKSTQVK